MSILQLNNFSKKFGDKVIFNNFNITIEKGESIAFTGASGCGKTTLLNALGLIDSIDQGEYSIEGTPVPKVNTAKSNKIIREKISYLFQNFALIDNITVEDNLMLALKYVKMDKNKKRDSIALALDKVGLKGYEKKKVYTISGGEQQRVSIARLLLKPSSIILADEPTGSLDGNNRDEILAILHDMCKTGKTLIIVTHDPVVAKSCDRVVELKSFKN